jgi:hypothetical protein
MKGALYVVVTACEIFWQQTASFSLASDLEMKTLLDKLANL